MRMTVPAHLLRLGQLRPLVRYVDERQAVVDVHIQMRGPFPAKERVPLPQRVQVRVSIDTQAGFHEESTVWLPLQGDTGMVRMELVEPERWWPAGLGEQALYELKVALLYADAVVEEKTCELGLTSIRRRRSDTGCNLLLVNGREFAVQAVVPIDHFQENRLLPVTGDALLVVRDHYGPDVLYDAADRAGILLIQCIPLDAGGVPEQQVADEVTRLSRHPSLVGWCVSPQGELARDVARCITALDPTHAVFTAAPGSWAA